MENPIMDYFESEPLEELVFMEPLNNSLLPINFNNINNMYSMEHQTNGELVVDKFLNEIGEIFDNSNDQASIQSPTNNQRTYANLMPLSTNIDQNTVDHNEMVAFSHLKEDYQFDDNQNSTNNQRTYTTLMPISSNISHSQVQHNENNNLIANLSNPVACCNPTETLVNNQTTTNIVTGSANSMMTNEVPLQIYDLNEVSWVYASHRISKSQKTPKICYQPNQSIISEGANLFIYYDLYEMPYTCTITNSNQNLLMPRISAHRMRTSNKKVFPVKPLVEPMTLESDGMYHFQMPPFILNKTKEYGPTLRKEWRLKYNELLEIIGNIDELHQSDTKNTNLNVQIDNLISKHLLDGTNIYKYVCLGIYICEKFMDENSKIRYRQIDGPFYSEKLATLQKENL